MNKVKIRPKMWLPPFPETVDIYNKIKLHPTIKDGIILYLDSDTTLDNGKATSQYRAVDSANGIKTDWSPCGLHKPPSKHKAIWGLWGQYCLQLRRRHQP